MLSQFRSVRAYQFGALAVAGMVLVGTLAGFIHLADSGQDPLTPDPAAVHYHYSYPKRTPGSADSEAAGVIAALEEKIARPQPSAIELAELADLYFARGMQTGDRQASARAEELAARSLALLPWPNSSALTLAKLKNARHEFRESIRIAREVLGKGGSGARAVLVSSHLALGELTLAAEYAEAAVTARPDSGAYLLRALVLEAQGRDQEAAFDFTRAASGEDHGAAAESARVRALWGRFLMRRGKLDGAAALYDEALRIQPDFPLALGLRGELLLRRGEFAAAQKDFEQAFQVSRQVRYLMDEARARQLKGDRAGASAIRTQVERLVRAELAGSGFGHRLDLAEVLIDSGRVEALAEAVELARAEVAARPSADARFQLARALYRKGDQKAAQEQIRAILSSGAREAEFYELAARVDSARATLYRKLAGELDPHDSGWRRLGL